jgi:ATP-dependent RNA helicase DHX37/DHR1
LFHKPPPDYLVYSEITKSGGASGKTWMKGLSGVNPAWVAELGKGFVGFRKPQELAGLAIGKARKGMAAEVKEGEREVVVVPFIRELGVELPGKKMTQKREGTRWVLVE